MLRKMLTREIPLISKSDCIEYTLISFGGFTRSVALYIKYAKISMQTGVPNANIRLKNGKSELLSA